MTHEAVRWLNALLGFTLIWVWILWAALRVHNLASRIVAWSCLLAWAFFSAGAMNAAINDLEFNAVANWGPPIFGTIVVAVTFDTIRALRDLNRSAP